MTAVNVSSRELTLVWVEPLDNNAPITGYMVTVVGERERVVNTSVEMATISGLLPGMVYTFTVTAVNEIGESPPSDPLILLTLDEGWKQN